MAARPHLRDIFTPGGFPSITYVSRDHLELERKLADALARGFAFNVVTGPTKSGKTVLCRRVLKAAPLITVEGGRIRTEADFWTHIRHQLRIESSASSSQTDTATTTLTTEGGGGIPGVFQAKGGFTQADADQKGFVRTYESVPIIAALETLLQTKTSLLVDDFHYIPPEVQKNLIQALKAPVFDGLTVFLIAVPHRAFDPMTVESEVEGRFKHISIPQWSLDDLVKIPSQGFPALNIRVDRATQRRICEDSFGNPLLVQEICSELCLRNGIREYSARYATIDSSLLEPTYREMAQSKGFPTYQKLKSGPKGRRARQLRKMKGGGQEDIYTAIIASLARLGPKFVTTFEEIRGSLRDLIDEELSLPPKAEIISGLRNMDAVAKDRLQGEPPLEWVDDRHELVITDPFLLFYLKWSFRDQRVVSGAPG